MNQEGQENIQDGGLFQSRIWAQFQEACGKKVKEIDEEVYLFSIEETISFIGKSAYIPRGPLAQNKEELQYAAEKLTALKETGEFVFLRIEPQSETQKEEIENFFTGEFIKAARDIQPREILMIDITLPEDTLLAQMKSKTRYNIRLAEKQGVSVRATREEKDIEDFLDLLAATAERKEIHFHPREYYSKFLRYFKREECELLVAEKEGVILAGVIILYFSDTAYYLHGGSSNQGRSSMAPHLLQWEAMRRAKQKGCKQYDLGGVAVQSASPTGKDWSGITRFKQGFAPKTETILFPGAYDIVSKKWRYALYRGISKIRKIFV